MLVVLKEEMMKMKDKHLSVSLFVYSRKRGVRYLEILNCKIYTRVGDDILLFNNFHIKGKRKDLKGYRR